MGKLYPYPVRGRDLRVGMLLSLRERKDGSVSESERITGIDECRGQRRTHVHVSAKKGTGCYALVGWAIIAVPESMEDGYGYLS